jgi:hypothetical protein
MAIVRFSNCGGGCKTGGGQRGIMKCMLTNLQRVNNFKNTDIGGWKLKFTFYFMEPLHMEK